MSTATPQATLPAGSVSNIPLATIPPALSSAPISTPGLQTFAPSSTASPAAFSTAKTPLSVPWLFKNITKVRPWGFLGFVCCVLFGTAAWVQYRTTQKSLALSAWQACISNPNNPQILASEWCKKHAAADFDEFTKREDPDASSTIVFTYTTASATSTLASITPTASINTIAPTRTLVQLSMGIFVPITLLLLGCLILWLRPFIKLRVNYGPVPKDLAPNCEIRTVTVHRRRPRAKSQNFPKKPIPSNKLERARELYDRVEREWKKGEFEPQLQEVHSQSIIADEPQAYSKPSTTSIDTFDGNTEHREYHRNPLPLYERAKAHLVRYLEACDICRFKKVRCDLDHHDLSLLKNR